MTGPGSLHGNSFCKTPAFLRKPLPTASDLQNRYEPIRPLFVKYAKNCQITVPATKRGNERNLSNITALSTPTPKCTPVRLRIRVAARRGHLRRGLLPRVEREGQGQLILLVMGGDDLSLRTAQYTNFTDSINIYNWAFKTYTYQEVLKLTDSFPRYRDPRQGRQIHNPRAGGLLAFCCPPGHAREHRANITL